MRFESVWSALPMVPDVHELLHARVINISKDIRF